MKKYTNKDIKSLFSGLCCSKCKNEFIIDSIKVIEKENDILLCNLSCAKCGNDFGEILFNFNRKAENHLPLNIIEGPPPISYNDVIEAHKFIKKLN